MQTVELQADPWVFALGYSAEDDYWRRRINSNVKIWDLPLAK